MNATQAIASKTEQVACPRCNGKGHFVEFSGIWGGTCFQCKGSGKVAYRASKRVVRPVTAYQAERIQIIKTGDLSAMSYAQLHSLREFAHWPIPQCPELLNIWRERGDSHFFSAQEQNLSEMYSNR